MAPSRILALLAISAAVVVAQDSASTTRQQTTTARASTTAAGSAQRTQITDLPDLSATTSSSTRSASSIELSDAPSITSATASQFILTGALPTIAGVGIPTIVIPYTADAPFMQKSSAPEGTVFIIVGAVLGFLGMCILAWRGLVAWSLHRSVKKAARAPFNDNDSKTLLTNTTKSGVYGMSTLGTSTMSIDKMSGLKSIPGGRLSKTTAPSANNTAAGRSSNLFFSPTAGAGSHNHAGGMGTPGNRSSNFLPAGYYSQPSAVAPAQGASSAHIGSTSTLQQLNPLGPVRAGYAPQRNFGPSPPDSPALNPRPSGDNMQRTYNGQQVPPSRGSGHVAMYSQSSLSNLNLYTPGGNVNGGRAPSTNLEDLFDSRGNPSQRY